MAAPWTAQAVDYPYFLTQCQHIWGHSWIIPTFWDLINCKPMVVTLTTTVCPRNIERRPPKVELLKEAYPVMCKVKHPNGAEGIPPML